MGAWKRAAKAEADARPMVEDDRGELSCCRAYAGAPDRCPYDVFESADGSMRCVGCHLAPDFCTCTRVGPLIRSLVEVCDGA